MEPVERPVELPPSSPAWVAAHACLTRLRRAGFTAWFVGGAVRDLLLGRPVHDVDCCTDADPEAVQELFPEALAVGKAFGVMVVPHGGGLQTEIASFRSDEAYIDGRRPSGVRPASEAEDVHRRDFTINALLLDPDGGLVRDHVGGLEDLDRRLLRCIGDPAARLQEDRLRVLRGWRFAAHYDLHIHELTLQALGCTGLEGVSRERLLQEWCRGLAHPAGWAWWELISAAPQRAWLCPPGAPVERGMWTAAVAADAVLGTVLCLRELGTERFGTWLEELPWSRAERRRLAWLHGGLARRHDHDRLQRLRDQHHEHSAELAELIEALQAGGEPALAPWLASWDAERRRQLPPPCSGRDLIALGMQPGPLVGEALRAVEEAQLLGKLARREDLPAFLMDWLQDRSGIDLG